MFYNYKPACEHPQTACISNAAGWTMCAACPSDEQLGPVWHRTETFKGEDNSPKEDKAMWFISSSGRIQLKMTLTQAKGAAHQGQCDEDVKALSEVPAIARQLKKIDAETLRQELREYGAWDTEELSDHEQNLQRILWIAAGDIVEEKGR